MLIKDEGKSVPDISKRYKNMSVSGFNQMVRFFTEVNFPDAQQAGSITVTYKPADSEVSSSSITIPLQPDVQKLETMEMNMYRSGTTCYKMPASICAWFSECFGFNVVLVHLGANLRPVLFNLDPLPPSTTPSELNSESDNSEGEEPAGNSSWLNYLTGGYLGSSTAMDSTNQGRTEKITFADMAPYLIVSETSLVDVSTRLPEDQPMDITKFRPNIIISGAAEAWEEDFWGELSFVSSTKSDGRRIRLLPERNCVRCRSINIDYSTGKQGTNESGKVLSLLQKDRRVDIGAKYEPVFGRYAFLGGGNGEVISVGDDVVVEKINAERAVLGE
jgi:uncharacterized protein YcbX